MIKGSVEHRRVLGRFRFLRGFGGRLPDLVDYVVQGQANNETGGGTVGTRVGWLGTAFKGIKKTASLFQREAHPRPFTRAQVRFFHAQLGHDYQLPNHFYYRPWRLAISAYRSQLGPESGRVFGKSYAAKMGAIQRAKKRPDLSYDYGGDY